MNITLPFIPASLNELFGMHRFARAKYTKERKEEVAWLCKNLKNGPIVFPIEVSILIISKSKHKKDCDNYLGGAKSIIDGLVLGGVMPDDSTDWIAKISVAIEYGSEDKTIISFLPFEKISTA